MKRPVRWLLRIALVLFVVGVAAIITSILLLDTVVRQIVTRRLQAATGMEVKIGAVHVGLLAPTMTIEKLKLYNTAEFGGSLCFDMPELHLEYDPAAVRAGMIHLPLVRLNLAEIGLVQDKKGRSNFDALQKEGTPSPAHTNSVDRFKFAGIDTLDLSLGKLRFSKLGSGQKEEVDFNITNQILHNVKSETDLAGVAVLLALRGSTSPGKPGFDLSGLLKDLTAH